MDVQQHSSASSSSSISTPSIDQQSLSSTTISTAATPAAAAAAAKSVVPNLMVPLNNVIIPGQPKPISSIKSIPVAASTAIKSSAVAPVKSKNSTSSGSSDLDTSASFSLPMMDMGIMGKIQMFQNIFGSLLSKGGGGGGGSRCKPKCPKMKGYGKMSVMPGLGDKQAEREVKKYVDENTLAMLLMKAVATSGMCFFKLASCFIYEFLFLQ